MNTGLKIDLVTDGRKNRQCGKCTACCDGWLAAEINGEPLTLGKPCRYSSKKGCGIYETRPQFPCREFVCGWVIPNSPLPDWMRPSECGAIVFPWFEWRYQVVINAVPVGNKIPKRTLDWLMAAAKQQKRPLIWTEHIRDGEKFVGTRWSGFGPPSFMEIFQAAQKETEKAELVEMFSPKK